MSKHDLEKKEEGFGSSIWKCKNCGMETIRILGRFIKFPEECPKKEE